VKFNETSCEAARKQTCEAVMKQTGEAAINHVCKPTL
jgi:hypothetical protein